MGRYSRLGKNTILVFVGNIGSKMITFLMLPFYTKWLSVSDYGITDMVTIYVSFLLGIITLSLAEAVFIFPKDQDHSIQKKYFSSAFGICSLSFILTAFIFFVVKYALSELNIKNTFTEHTWTIYTILITSALQFFLQQFSRSLDKVIIYATSGIVLTFATAIFSFWLIPKYHLSGYFTAQIIALAITSTYTYTASKSYSFTSIKSVSKEACVEMLKYSMPLIPNGIMWWIISALNRPITEEYLGLHEVGIFAVANKFPAIIMILFSIFSYSWQISVIEEFKKENYKDFYNKMVQLIFSILILVSCGMTILSPYIIKIVDNKFIEASSYIPILSIGVVFSSFSGLVGTNFSAIRKSKYYFYSSVWGATASIILSLILIPSFKLYGACIAIVVPHLIMALSRLFYSWKYVKLEKLYKYVSLIIINLSLIVITGKYGMNAYSILIIVLLFIFYILLNRNLLISIIPLKK